MRCTVIKSKLGVMAASAMVLAVMPTMASAAVIILDTFSRSGDLNGTAPDIAQTPGDKWAAPTAAPPTPTFDYTTDGFVLQMPANSVGLTAYLPFTPSSGNVYKLSADLKVSDPSTSDWLTIGFLPPSPNVNAAIFSNQAAPWALLRGDGGVQAFGGPSVTNNFAAVEPAATAGVTTNLALILDTTGTFDTAKVLVNNVQIGTTFTYSTNPSIAFVALGSLRVAGTADNFTVTTPDATPEPASIGILAIGATALLARRRRA